MTSGHRRHELKEFLKGCHIIKGKEKMRHNAEIYDISANDENTVGNMTKYMSCDRKRRYSSLGEATERANYHIHAGHGYMRAYYCYLCHGYHLTSKRMKDKYKSM